MISYQVENKTNILHRELKENPQTLADYRWLYPYFSYFNGKWKVNQLMQSGMFISMNRPGNQDDFNQTAQDKFITDYWTPAIIDWLKNLSKISLVPYSNLLSEYKRDDSILRWYMKSAMAPMALLKNTEWITKLNTEKFYDPWPIEKYKWNKLTIYNSFKVGENFNIVFISSTSEVEIINNGKRGSKSITQTPMGIKYIPIDQDKDKYIYHNYTFTVNYTGAADEENYTYKVQLVQWKTGEKAGKLELITEEQK